MNIDIENFRKLQRNAINEARSKRTYYEGVIEGLLKAETLIVWSKTDKTDDICDDNDPLRNQKLRIHYRPNKEEES